LGKFSLTDGGVFWYGCIIGKTFGVIVVFSTRRPATRVSFVYVRRVGI